MGIFDIFSTGPAQQAAQAQIGGLNTGYGLASGNIQQALQALQGNYGAAGNALQTNYTAALQPYLQNYGQAQTGVTGLMNALGLGGAGGTQSALTALQNTPGYQFQQQQGNNAINAAAAASGTLNSGNQIKALADYNQGLAGTTYNNYVSQLQPFLGASQGAAGGIANTYSGLGSGLAGISTGLGQGLAGQYNNLAQLGWGYGTGVGNANANADLAAYGASGNLLGALGGLLGGAGKGLASGAGAGGGGGVDPSSLGAGLGTGLSSLFALFSDERLKEDIEPVGELYDGLGVYRYRYKGDPTPRIGLIAQEVEATNPDAVTEVAGFKAVDYGKATEFASKLAEMAGGGGDNVIAFKPREAEPSYTSTLNRFLEAA